MILDCTLHPSLPHVTMKGLMTIMPADKAIYLVALQELIDDPDNTQHIVEYKNVRYININFVWEILHGDLFPLHDYPLRFLVVNGYILEYTRMSSYMVNEENKCVAVDLQALSGLFLILTLNPS